MPPLRLEYYAENFSGKHRHRNSPLINTKRPKRDDLSAELRSLNHCCALTLCYSMYFLKGSTVLTSPYNQPDTNYASKSIVSTKFQQSRSILTDLRLKTGFFYYFCTPFKGAKCRIGLGSGASKLFSTVFFEKNLVVLKKVHTFAALISGKT